VLYEGLCGKRRFRAGSMHKVLEKVCNDEPVSLPQRDSSIPCELDRICSKAMSKRAADRYETAADMADDLPLFRNENDAATDSVSRVQSLEGSVLTGSSKLTRSTKSSSVSVAVQVVPKGLQSFGAEDADFFLALLPGTKDRDGLPASVRFWTNRIEGRQSEELFRVGLI
jgi:serine/threonine protein kinase